MAWRKASSAPAYTHQEGDVDGGTVVTGAASSSANTSKERCCFQGFALEGLPKSLPANHPIER